MRTIKPYIKLMRMHHYIKNLLVFAALTCSGELFRLDKLFAGVIAFVAFCLVSSVVYIANDIQDVERDRLHSAKCSWPIASGQVSAKNAKILAAALLLSAALCAALVRQRFSVLLLALYLALNLAYSFGLKNIPLVDVCILTAGFLIRVMYGAVVTGIEISNWLYLTVITLAFYFSLGKRRNELKRIGDGNTRYVLRFYSVPFLDKNMYMCLALANVFYALWCMDSATIALYGNKSLILTVPVVLLISMRYSMDVEGDSDGDPVEVLLHDRGLLILCGTYFAAMFLILYFLGGGSG